MNLLIANFSKFYNVNINNITTTNYDHNQKNNNI